MKATQFFTLAFSLSILAASAANDQNLLRRQVIRAKNEYQAEKVVLAIKADYDGWYTLENPVGGTYNDTVRQASLVKSWLK